MPPTQAESVIRSIIREIGQECAAHGEIVSETLIAFMVKAVVLDPSNGFNMDRTLMKSDVQNLVKLCMTRLLDTKNPSLDTIKMQVYFDMNYTNRGNIYYLFLYLNFVLYFSKEGLHLADNEFNCLINLTI
uniref:Cilia- and flagella-associated protein 206 n=1 Tax=Mandrillus leucophaeus TaxID=9568 RepID=A0A2K5ZEG7_MANLE